MFKKKNNSKSKKETKAKKDLKLLVVKSNSKTPAAVPTETVPLPPAAPAPPSAVQLEPLPWSEWTWDTNQQFYFRARMGHDGWQYEYNIPSDYQKRREDMRWFMSLPDIPAAPGRLEVNEIKNEVYYTEDAEMDSVCSGSDTETILRSVESGSDSGSSSTSDSESDNSSQVSEQSLSIKKRAEKEGSNSDKESRRSSVIVTTTKNSSGEVIVEVLDVGPGSTGRKHEGSLKETSDWGYTSDDDW